MKAMSLRDPWGTLWAYDEKKCETRGRYTHHRGPLAIHIARTFADEELACALSEPFKSCLARHNFHVVEDWQGVSHNLPLGKIVAVTSIIDCVRSEDFPAKYPDLDTPQERAFGDFSRGRYIWIRGPVILMPYPVPCRGSLGLWDIPLDVDARIAMQFDDPGRQRAREGWTSIGNAIDGRDIREALAGLVGMLPGTGTEG